MRKQVENLDLDLLLEMGKRVEAIRLQKSMTQRQVAKVAGVSEMSVRRLESGEVGSRLSTFIAICRALELTDRFEVLLPKVMIQPVDMLRLQGKQRQRARPLKVYEHRAPYNWQWGDED
jgi:putative transcriptional regulator